MVLVCAASQNSGRVCARAEPKRGGPRHNNHMYCVCAPLLPLGPIPFLQLAATQRVSIPTGILVDNLQLYHMNAVKNPVKQV